MSLQGVGRGVRRLGAVVGAAWLLVGCEANEPNAAEEFVQPDSAQATEEVDFFSEPLSEEARQGPVGKTAITQPQPGRDFPDRIRNAMLATHVRLLLAEDPDLRAYDFAPTVQNGVVTLDGAVRTSAERQRAASLVAAIDGVDSVTNQVALEDTAGLRLDIGLAPLESAVQRGTPATAAPDDALALSDDMGTDSDDTSTDDTDTPEATPPAATPPASTSATSTYTIRSGDTFGAIARRQGISVADLERLNPGVDARRIRPGQEIRVGGSPASGTSSGTASSSSASTSSAQYHTIRSGDTLGKIASQYGTSVSALQRLNPDVNPRRIRPGQRIRVK